MDEERHLLEEAIAALRQIRLSKLLVGERMWEMVTRLIERAEVLEVGGWWEDKIGG